MDMETNLINVRDYYVSFSSIIRLMHEWLVSWSAGWLTAITMDMVGKMYWRRLCIDFVLCPK